MLVNTGRQTTSAWTRVLTLVLGFLCLPTTLLRDAEDICAFGSGATAAPAQGMVGDADGAAGRNGDGICTAPPVPVPPDAGADTADTSCDEAGTDPVGTTGDAADEGEDTGCPADAESGDGFAWGKVLWATDELLMVSEHDDDAGCDVEALYVIVPETELGNFATLSDLVPDDDVIIDYEEFEGARVAATVVREDAGDEDTDEGDDEDRFSFGRVVAVRAGAITVREYDFERDEDVEVVYAVVAETELGNIDELAELQPDDDVVLDYQEIDGQRVATTLVREEAGEEGMDEDEDENADESENRDASEDRFSFGRVVAVWAEAITVREYDFERDADVNVLYRIAPETEFGNVDAATDLRVGDNVVLNYTDTESERLVTTLVREDRTREQGTE